MDRFFCVFQSGSSNRFLFHHEKGPDGLTGKERFEKSIDKMMENNPDNPYEVVREKPGYTHTTGPTLVLGDESSKGLAKLMILSKFGAGRCYISGKKEVANQGQTTVDLLEKVKKSAGLTMKIYANAIIQIGKHDILGSSDSAQEIYKRMQKIWAYFDKHKMKIHVSTIPPIEGANMEQERRRIELNKLIRGTDEPIFNVIDIQGAMEEVDTETPNLYIHDQTKEAIMSFQKPEGKHWKLRRKTPKTEQEKMAVAYLAALTAGGRDNFKRSMDKAFQGPPRAPYVVVGDAYTKPLESSMGGAKKSPGQYVSSVDPQKPLKPRAIPAPGKNTEKMAEKMEKEIVPMLQKKPSYRCAIIQAGAEDVLGRMTADADMWEAEKAITSNIKRMYRACLESEPPIMVVAVTLPPMSAEIDKAYPGEENAEQRRRCKELWKKVNEFIIKETHRLSQHPLDWYKRIMCVRAHDMIGTRKGYIRAKYKGERGLNEAGNRQMAMQISKAVNQMKVGIEFGKKFIPGFHPDKFNLPHHKKYRNKKGQQGKERNIA